MGCATISSWYGPVDRQSARRLLRRRLADIDLARDAAPIQNDPLFPEGVNVSVAELVEADREKYQAGVNPLTVPLVLKEARDAHRVIVVEFPSYDAAKACHDDPAYQIAREYALQASNRELLILKGELE